MEEKIFREFLEKKGCKFTNERAAILREVFSNHGHFDPEDLFFEIRKKGMKASRASVYRTLQLLLECGLVEQVERVDKHAHYEHTFGHKHHDHLICVKCGRVMQIYSEKLEQLQKNLCKKEKFRCVSHTLEMRGYCEKCSGKRI